MAAGLISASYNAVADTGGGLEIRQLPHSYIGAFRQVSVKANYLPLRPDLKCATHVTGGCELAMGRGCFIAEPLQAFRRCGYVGLELAQAMRGLG